MNIQGEAGRKQGGETRSIREEKRRDREQVESSVPSSN